MRTSHKTALVLAGAIAFDLGVLVVASYAATGGEVVVDDYKYKYKDDKVAKAVPQTDEFLKFGGANTPQSCVTKGDKVTSQNGVPGCLHVRKAGENHLEY